MKKGVKKLTDFSKGTPFQHKVWRAIQTIPRGEVRTYQWIAEKIGKPNAARAVGQACKANPYAPIIPCHRVVASHGKIGGYTGGLHKKRRLLRLEGFKLK